MATIRQLRQRGKELLYRAIYRDLGEEETLAALDADVLLGHVLTYDKTKLLVEAEAIVEEDAELRYIELLLRRSTFEPIAYILGTKEFFGLEFYVSPAVLVPRPDTELLVERALEFVEQLFAAGENSVRVIDVGTGSGAIILSLLSVLREKGQLEKVEAIATDISEGALLVAKRNAEKFELLGNVSFFQGDLLRALPSGLKKDLLPEVIISNPPYIGLHAELPPDVIRFEPKSALFSGKDGLGIYRRLIPQALSRLSGCSGGILLEIGYDQAAEVVSILPAGLSVSIYKDLAGIERVVFVEKKSGR